MPELRAVITPVGNQRLGRRQGVKHKTCALVIAHLPFAEHHDDRTAFTVTDGMQLGVQSAFNSPDTTGNIPFLSRLAAVRCAFRVGGVLLAPGHPNFDSTRGIATLVDAVTMHQLPI